MTVETLTLTTTPGASGSYRSLYTHLSDVSQVSNQAEARVVAHRFNRMLLFDRQSNGFAHGRSQSQVKRDGNEHLSVHFLIKGRLIGGTFGSKLEVKPGEILLFDTTQSMWSQAVDAHYVTAWIARDQIARRTGDLRSFSGMALPESACGLLGDFMKMMSRRASDMPSQTAESASRVMGELISSTLSGNSISLNHAVSDDVGTLMRQERIKAFIASRLSDPTLGVQDIASGTGFSRASVYRALKDFGGVIEFIQTQRLMTFRNALRRESERRSLSNLAYACGFSSQSHCSRLFREMFDTSPSQFRARMHHKRSSPAPKSAWSEGLDHWRSELY